MYTPVLVGKLACHCHHNSWRLHKILGNYYHITQAVSGPGGLL